ncbi:MAG: 1-deoxy-D-xylulose-5-phosphate synthase [Pedosphaera sp.]|nr:1-deoxy-D-xylulose-5-phosphate synthase [Pedosphaera sp.]
MSRYLDMVDHPDHVKKLTMEQLDQLAAEVREELINKLAKTGGHLGPNLGVVELTIAMHRVFSTPKDKFIWDVSHQVYVHKLLTGRKDRFHTIRTTDGLNGFALRTESEHDCYGAGHAGTALSAALGMCAARDQRGSDEQVVCVFGDAALTNGISFEALNNIAGTTKKFIGILNDNEWSIDKNVGAVASYLNKIITNPSYNRMHKGMERFMRKLPKGDLALRLGHKAEEALKGAVSNVSLQHVEGADADGRGGAASSLIFEELGIRYIGPIDGHDLPLLIDTLEFAKSCDHPVVLHVLTKKGKGYEAALQLPEKFHGTGPYDAATGKSPAAKPGTAPAYQDVFGEAMVQLCERDNRVVGITAAMPSGTGLKSLRDRMPQRYYDVGIAEEHAVLFAAGMATMGFHPVVAIYSTFLQRAYDCIIHDVALQDLPVIFCMDRAGLSANDGPTHHGLFDIAYVRCVPNCIAMAPKDEDELVDMMYTATRQNHPVFIRYPRGAGEGVAIKAEPAVLEIGKAEVVRHFGGNGKPKVAFFALGNMQSVAKGAIALLGEQCDCALINPRFIKPIDEAATEYFGRAADVVVTLEDHVLPGGYGSTVMELFAERRVVTPIVRIGWPDQFIEHASSVDYLREKHGLTSNRAAAQVKALLEGGAVAAKKEAAVA